MGITRISGPTGAPVVLLVDDDPDFCLAMHHLLRACGFRVVLAGSGAEALDVLSGQTEIAIIMTDLFMPGMDGIELVRRLRKRDHQAIIVVTGDTHLATEASVAAAVSLGAHAFLLKPFSKEQLLEAVSVAVQRASAPSV